jgi:hypothetical protein
VLCTGLDLLDRLELLEKMRPSIIDWLYANLINTDIPFDPPGTNVKRFCNKGHLIKFFNCFFAEIVNSVADPDRVSGAF